MKQYFKDIPKLKIIDQTNTSPGYFGTKTLFSSKLSINHKQIISKLSVFADFSHDLNFLNHLIKIEFENPFSEIEQDKKEQETIFFMVD